MQGVDKTRLTAAKPPPFQVKDRNEGVLAVFSFASPRVHFSEFTPEAAQRARPPLSPFARVALGLLTVSFLLSGSGFVSPSPVVRVNRLFLEAEVSCTPEGRVRLPREFNLLAALPGTRTTHQDQERLVRFSVQKQSHTALWVKREELVIIEGDVLSVTSERNDARKKGVAPSHAEWNIGSVDWSKVHCPAPREDGKAQKFSVVLPVGIDPSFRINLERKLGFSCRRSWGIEENESQWARASSDLLSFSSRSSSRNRSAIPLRFESLNTKTFNSWASCRRT